MLVRTRLQKRLKKQSEENASLLLSATFYLVNAGFVSARELGSISQVCKSANERVHEETELWATLCHRQFPEYENVFGQFVEKKGHEWLFKHLAVSLDHLCAPPELDPPSCTCEDFQLVICVRYDGAQIYRHVIDSPSQLKSCFENDCFATSSETPVDLGKAVWDFNVFEKQIYERGNNVTGLSFTCDRNDFDIAKLSLSIILIRHADDDVPAIISLYDSTRVQAVYPSRPGKAHPLVANDGSAFDRTSAFDFSKKRVRHIVTIRESQRDIKPWSLKKSRQADAIMRRLPLAVRFVAHLFFNVVEGDRFVLEGIGVLPVKYDPTGALIDFDSVKEAECHGVTLLHILSELQEA